MQLLFFHGKHCAPCKQMQKTAQAYAEHTGIQLFTFDSGDWYGGNDMARQHHVRQLPCLILLDDAGQEAARTETVHTLETLHKAFDKYLTQAVEGGEASE